MEATFVPAGFLEYWPYKIRKIGYGLFSYVLQRAKRTSASFMGEFLEEYLVAVKLIEVQWITVQFIQ